MLGTFLSHLQPQLLASLQTQPGHKDTLSQVHFGCQGQGSPWQPIKPEPWAQQTGLTGPHSGAVAQGQTLYLTSSFLLRLQLQQPLRLSPRHGPQPSLPAGMTSYHLPLGHHKIISDLYRETGILLLETGKCLFLRKTENDVGKVT